MASVGTVQSSLQEAGGLNTRSEVVNAKSISYSVSAQLSTSTKSRPERFKLSTTRMTSRYLGVYGRD